MKKLLAIFALCFCGTILADDFEKFQNNIRFRTGDYGLEMREEINSNKDHLQMSYFGIKDTEIRLRYVDNIGSKEWRPQVSYFVYRGDNFFFRPRLDYRHFLGDNSNYFSFRTSFGGRYKIDQHYDVWAEVNPIWDFGIDKTSDAQLDKAQFRFGMGYTTVRKLKIEPFIQYETNGHFNHTETFLGTTTSINF
jgi:hypothetical protein